jgi:hypothetical protein
MAYNPDNMPTVETLDDLREYVFGELQMIAQEFNGQNLVNLTPVGVLPLRPRDGMVICSDGTIGGLVGGKGLYEFKSGTGWVKL